MTTLPGHSFNYNEFREKHPLAMLVNHIGKAAGYPSSHGYADLTAHFEHELARFIDARVQQVLDQILTNHKQTIALKEELIEAQRLLIEELRKGQK